MQLKRILRTALLAGLCCLSLAACTPETTPSEPEVSGSSDTLETTLLLNGWDAADFTVLSFDKYGPMDGASPVTLTHEEQRELLSLLDIGSWEEFDPADSPQHGLTPWLILSAEDGRTFIVWDGAETGKTLFTLQETEDSAKMLYASSSEVSQRAKALQETVSARKDSLLPLKEAEILYPDLLPQEVTSANAYEMAKADPAAVISWEGQIATGRTAVDAFQKAVESGGTGELTLYSFSPSDAEPGMIRCSYTRFWTDGGSAWRFSDSSEDSRSAFTEPSRHTLQSLELNDHGCLVATGEGGEPISYPVIADQMLREETDLPIRVPDGWSEGMTRIVETVSRNYTEQRDTVCEGELTEEDVARVWYLVNTIYDADDVAFVDDMAEPPEGVPAGIFSRFLDFEEATRYLFTDHGMEQLLSAEIAGAPYIYKAENGEVYHRGPYKTGYAYQNALTGYRVIRSDGDSAQVEASWKIMAPLDWKKERPEAFSTLYLKREDGRWKVDSYNFPDASYPEEFTITEELRVALADGEKETALLDAGAKEQVLARLRELTSGTLTQEAPPEDCIAVQAIDNGAVYHISVAPDGRVWDTLYAGEEWGLYQTDPSFYQALQALLA